MSHSAFSIIGPPMIGPSSSHTAGAVRIGLAARALLKKPPVHAKIELHGSFAATGKGHATDRALVAGLLGFAADDERLKDSLVLAKEAGLEVEFLTVDLGEESHPNATRIHLSDTDGNIHSLVGWSVGGGSIQIREIDGFATSFDAELSVCILWNKDHQGYIAKVTTLYACADINIATIHLNRSGRGADALTVIESDTTLPDTIARVIEDMPDTLAIRRFNLNNR
jgi:L-serine dehydratase